MFECKLEQAVLFKKVVAAVLDIVKEGNFDLSDEGIRVQTMDTTHVALVQMELKESAFDEFRCDRESCVGINFEALTKLLKLCRDDDSLSLKKEEDCDTLTITSAGEGRAVECDMNLMDIENEQLGVPDCEYSCEIKMKCSQFAKICRDLKDCGGENLRIDCDKNSVKFSMKCDGHVKSSSIKLEHDVEITHCKEAVENLCFSLRYLLLFTNKACALSDDVTLRLSAETPLMIDYCVADSPEKGFVRYFLAPKLDDE
ncbi:proliferating cell nuclear antigen, putative [Perkinsus marinus ATCC 50983]|uniref:DNA sliding clamp PCNA n=1 Tax=Perkinsus marinus (strain ATCC 50983 / TXsc) TaxID=423536 RepID=C5KI10_PERM5|nr:proliferating cell nuclear antigen, putative [Perkinsus marinus ATCC 50983]EER16222.1 proliferating cell nuclear antigen, putative [Perkinsus marinus ATCC 50983]|eukprot:XP_002784426.1 proliferating cell nuclear antigen, putative [Perkinsus marinus ATCC 50983]